MLAVRPKSTVVFSPALPPVLEKSAWVIAAVVERLRQEDCRELKASLRYKPGVPAQPGIQSEINLTIPAPSLVSLAHVNISIKHTLSGNKENNKIAIQLA